MSCSVSRAELPSEDIGGRLLAPPQSKPPGSGQRFPFPFSCRPSLLFGCLDSRLKGQLDSARAIIEGVAKGAVPDESKKRLRIGTAGSDRAGSSLSALEG